MVGDDEELAWLTQITGKPILETQDLKDGVVLCTVANILLPGSARARVSAMPFVQRENIASFLAAARQLGVDDHELFETEDLFDDKDLKLVNTTIRALSRVAHDRDASVPVIGPVLAKKHTPPPRPKRKPIIGWNEHQYGTMKGASQAGSAIDGRRDIVIHYQTPSENRSSGLDRRDNPNKPLFPPT